MVTHSMTVLAKPCLEGRARDMVSGIVCAHIATMVDGVLMLLDYWKLGGSWTKG